MDQPCKQIVKIIKIIVIKIHVILIIKIIITIKTISLFYERITISYTATYNNHTLVYSVTFHSLKYTTSTI